ncbi:MAG: hypothetical protein ACLP50_17085 [Solirubrobacteraceae bacterium]
MTASVVMSAPCETTHVLLPAWSVPRRRDGAEVISRALVGVRREMGRRAERGPGTAMADGLAASVRARRAGQRGDRPAAAACSVRRRRIEELIVAITGGLLSGQPRDPLGY